MKHKYTMFHLLNALIINSFELKGKIYVSPNDYLGIDFNEKEANAIYYGIMTTASKHNLSLDSAKRVEATTDKFLGCMNWDGCSDFRRECVTSWTKLFATKDVVYTESL